LKTGCWGEYLDQAEEVVGGWRRLHNEELHNLYTSPNIIRVIILRRMRWVEHEPHMGEVRNAYVSLENLKGRDHSEYLGIDGKIILEWILGKYGGKVWTRYILLSIGISDGLL
jgi:hypothetical protein